MDLWLWAFLVKYFMDYSTIVMQGKKFEVKIFEVIKNSWNFLPQNI